MNLMKKLLFGLLLTGALFTTACGSDDAKKANGEACTAASECESNNCDATSNKCAPAAPVKKGDGETCTKNDECTSDNCDATSKKCAAAPVKKGDGETCAKNDECTSDNCDATSKVCAAKPPAHAGPGQPCSATITCADAGPRKGVCVSFGSAGICSLSCTGTVTDECRFGTQSYTCKDVTPLGGSATTKACTL